MNKYKYKLKNYDIEYALDHVLNTYKERVFYEIRKKKIILYTNCPGIVIGKQSHTINQIKYILKKHGYNQNVIVKELCTRAIKRGKLDYRR